jgi:DeoR family fructose operon transcriptional repressor
VIRQAALVFVLATADKLGRASQQHWTPLDRPWTLITDDEASVEQLDPFRARDEVDVEIAPLE